MKIKHSFFVLALLALAGCSKLIYAQIDTKAVENSQTLPKGTYFIVNEGGLALTPHQPGLGTNVFARPFSKSGTQKWDVSPQEDGSYIIKPADSELYFEPHDIQERTAILDATVSGATFSITANSTSSTSWNITSRKFRDDAMCTHVSAPELPTEVRFTALEEDKKFRWKFILAE